MDQNSCTPILQFRPLALSYQGRHLWSIQPQHFHSSLLKVLQLRIQTTQLSFYTPAGFSPVIPAGGGQDTKCKRRGKVCGWPIIGNFESGTPVFTIVCTKLLRSHQFSMIFNKNRCTCLRSKFEINKREKITRFPHWQLNMLNYLFQAREINEKED